MRSKQGKQNRIISVLKWLYPGMHVKRWIAVVLVGVVLVTGGVGVALNRDVIDYLNAWGEIVLRFTPLNLAEKSLPSGIVLIAAGLLLILFGVRQVMISVAGAISPQDKDRLADVIYRKRTLAQGHRIVVLGGGTGLSTLLRGLKTYTSNITAIVTVTDDGGSSGRLQREYGVLPPGDIRNCLVALADAEPLMQELFQFRFDKGATELEGHSFGNLLIAAMTRITGDFEKAVKETSQILAIRGTVLPSTLDNVRLGAKLVDGTEVLGETKITGSAHPVEKIFLSPGDVHPLEDALLAIEQAQLIILGPGSVYTSIIPNILVQGISDAIANSSAPRAYICNVMTQPGETDNFSASDHVRALLNHTDKRLFDYVLVNTKTPSSDLLKKYAQQNAYRVEPDIDKIKELGFRPMAGDFISETDLVRHNPEALAKSVMSLLKK